MMPRTAKKPRAFEIGDLVAVNFVVDEIQKDESNASEPLLVLKTVKKAGKLIPYNPTVVLGASQAYHIQDTD